MIIRRASALSEIQETTGQNIDSVPLSLFSGSVRRYQPFHMGCNIHPTQRKSAFNFGVPLSILVPGSVSRREGKVPPTHNRTYSEIYRVADDSLDRYELYMGEDQMPDWEASDQPVATSSSLPFSHTPPAVSSGQTLNLYCVVRKRNKYNLLSHNQHPTIIELNDLGEEEYGPVTDPEIIRILDGAIGEIKIFARYPYGVDRWPADTWEVYVKEGTDPDPDVDSPDATVTMRTAAADYLLSQSITGLTENTTYHVLVTAIRSDDSAGSRGESDVSQHTTAEAIDLSADDAELFGS